MDNITGALHHMPQSALDGREPSTDDSTPPLHPRHHVARSVTSVVRTAALFLLVTGGVGAFVWHADFRQAGALSGTANGIVIAVLLGTVFLAVAAAAFAYVIDLLFLIDWNAKFVSERSESDAYV